MKPKLLIGTIVGAFLFGIAGFTLFLKAAEPAVGGFEYATLRWDGPDNTHLIRPSGNVEMLDAKFAGVKKPARTDARSFYMNLAMNALAREGFEAKVLNLWP